MEALGWQKFHTRRLLNPYYEGHPEFFCQNDHHDTVPGDAEVEADRKRKLWLYPAINTVDLTITVLYRKEVTALSADADEPIIPIEDRDILVYGTEQLVWKNLVRDLESSEASKRDFDDKLKDMLNRNEAGQDYPMLTMDSTYHTLKRLRNGAPRRTN